MIEPWMIERLSREAAHLRWLVDRSRNDPNFRTSDEISNEVANTTESVSFALNWIADGNPNALAASLGYDWDALQRGPANQRVLVQLSAVETILGDQSLDNHIEFDYDAFVSHASDDKDDFVRPLVDELVTRDLRIWFDEHSLEVGHSLREKIDEGLAKSRYGIVVISPAFLQKNWTNRELNGLTSRQMEGARVILPVWYNVTYQQILQYSPPLADTVALVSGPLSIRDIGNKLFTTIRGIRRRGGGT